MCVCVHAHTTILSCIPTSFFAEKIDAQEIPHLPNISSTHQPAPRPTFSAFPSIIIDDSVPAPIKLKLQIPLAFSKASTYMLTPLAPAGIISLSL